MVNVPWPAIFSPTHFHYYHIDQDRSGGQSLGGGEQIVVSPGARWGAKMTLPIWNTEQLLEIRALRSALKGRTNPVLLPNFDRHHLPVPNPAATFKAAFPIGTTDVTANFTVGGAVELAGTQFGASSHLYEIVASFAVGADHHLTIWPPLRTAVALGQDLAWIGAANAVCLMRCINMSEQLQQLTDLHFAVLELEFEEYI